MIAILKITSLLGTFDMTGVCLNASFIDIFIQTSKTILYLYSKLYPV